MDEDLSFSLEDTEARLRASSLAEQEASALAAALGVEGDELRFEDVTFTVSGELAGAAYALPLTARGVATFTARQLTLEAVPPILPCGRVVVQLADVLAVGVEKPMFGMRRVKLRIERGEAALEAASAPDTDAVERALRERWARACAAVAAEAYAATGTLRPTGRHFALVDPDNPALLTLCREMEHEHEREHER